MRASLVVSLCAAALVAAVPAHAGTTTTLALAGFGDLAVDPVRERVYVTGGPGDSSVVALSFAGAVVGTVEGQPGAAGLALDAGAGVLYVALSGSNAISAISTETLEETGRISLAPASGPVDLSLAGGRLWFSHDCGSAESRGLASIALDGTGLAQYTGPAYPTRCPLLATSPADGNALVATGVGTSPPRVFVYDVSTGAPVEKASASLSGLDDFEDIDVLPDGGSLVGAAGWPYALQQLSLTDVSTTSTYPMGAYPVASATSSDGAFLAGGRSTSGGPDVYVFPAGSSTPLRTYDFGASAEIHDAGLAFSPDDSKLFAVSETAAGTGVVFRVHDLPTVAPRPTTTALTVSAAKAVYGRKVTVTARLLGAQRGRVSIYATPHFGTKTLVRTGAVNASGKISVTVRMRSRTTFVAEFEGDDARAPSASPGKVVRVRATARAILSGFYGRAGAYRLYRLGATPKVAGRVAPGHVGATLRFVAQRQVGSRWATFDTESFPIGGDGAAHAVLHVGGRGNMRVRVVFAGDGDHLGHTSAWAYLRVT